FQQMLAERGASDGHERPARAGAPAVERPREHAFTRTAFAREQYGYVRLGGLPSRLDDSTHARIARFEKHGAIERATQGAVLAAEREDLENPIERQADLLDRKWLDQVVVRTRPHGLDRLGDGGIGGHQHDDDVRPSTADLAEQGETVEARHANIGEDDVDSP